MGQDNNVKETFSIIKGWEVLKEDSIYTQKTMDIIAENLAVMQELFSLKRRES